MPFAIVLGFRLVLLLWRVFVVIQNTYTTVCALCLSDEWRQQWYLWVVLVCLRYPCVVQKCGTMHARNIDLQLGREAKIKKRQAHYKVLTEADPNYMRS
jgi:hypothetical protein